VRFWDDGLSVSVADHGYEDPDLRTSPLRPPYVYLNALTLDSYKRLVLDDRLPISISLSSPNLGTTKLTSGYSEADLGAFERRIVNQRTQVLYLEDTLVLAFDVETTPVDPASVHARMSAEDRAPKTFNFEFRVPIESIPEVFNFTERERQDFIRLRARKSNG
jgi:hypothetical protein